MGACDIHNTQCQALPTRRTELLYIYTYGHRPCPRLPGCPTDDTTACSHLAPPQTHPRTWPFAAAHRPRDSAPRTLLWPFFAQSVASVRDHAQRLSVGDAATAAAGNARGCHRAGGDARRRCRRRRGPGRGQHYCHPGPLPPAARRAWPLLTHRAARAIAHDRARTDGAFRGKGRGPGRASGSQGVQGDAARGRAPRRGEPSLGAPK